MNRSSRYRIGLLATFGALALPAGAAELRAQDAQESPTHVVRRGDTLWDLARLYLDDPFLWPTVYEANRSIVRNPHWIYPNQRLVIPPGARRAAAPVQPPAAPVHEADPPRQFAAAPPAEPPTRTRFYRPPPPTSARADRPLVEGEFRVAAPLVAPAEFDAAPWLDHEAALAVVGRLIRTGEPGAELERLRESVHRYDRVFLTYSVDGPRPRIGDEVLLVDVGPRVEEPGTRRHEWRRRIEPRAVATVVAMEPEVFIAVVRRQFGVLERGALALPLPPYPLDPDAETVPVQHGPGGHVLSYFPDDPRQRPSSRAFLDIGRADGVSVGDEVVIFLPDRPLTRRREERLPPEPAAWARVIKVTENTSTVRLTRVADPMLHAGLPARVVARVATSP